MRNYRSRIENYCTGCGLCYSIKGSEENGSNEFRIPDLNDIDNINLCESLCPANGKHLLKQDNTTWGFYKNVHSGYANDNEIRFKASSGGTTTAIAVYLVESGLVDGIIQVGEDETNPFTTKNYISRSKEDVISHCGSRYIQSNPLSNFQQVLSKGGKYAIIGRPCDIVTINNYLELFPQYCENVYCTISFFCAGVPSAEASKRLAERLGIKPSEVTKIRYRGYGWPGKTTVFTHDKTKHMEYIDAWNQVLGRDIRKICKFCTDGVGEAADISSGDLWNLQNGNPVFSETDGVNVVFSRTDRGEEIIKGAVEKGYIYLEDYSSKIAELDLVQPNHATRKKLLFPRILGMKIMNKVVPQYNTRKLKEFSKEQTLISIIKTVIGTVKRVWKGKL